MSQSAEEGMPDTDVFAVFFRKPLKKRAQAACLGGCEQVVRLNGGMKEKYVNRRVETLTKKHKSKALHPLRISGLLDIGFDTVDTVFGTSVNELHRPSCLEPPRPTDCLKRLAIRRPPAIPS
jgi:hypothetical protein